MSRMDAAASAALDGNVIRPVFFAYLDFLGDPLRANTAGQTMSFGAMADPDLSNATFDGIDPKVVSIGPVRMKDGGSETVRAKLSGIVGLDDALLSIVGNPANWQGRTARLWRMIRDEHGNQAGALQHYYTGYMVAVSIGGSPTSQTIEVSIESYLAAFADASNRTYLTQEDYDPGDLSARAAVALANGISGNPLVAGTPTPGVGGGGSYDSDPFGQLENFR
ncbi:hypothetical protein [uncultured Sphingomonas sp.]|uniref:hypothetical protein n=1 Tax=uncultured Sphingomonas sp. TaxID=158754 RepID=UPI0025F7469A|nr:hypothetical protein [uncultured Sphingomonas sp.]